MRGIISGYAGHRFLIPATRDQRKNKINTYWKQNGSHLIHAMGVDTHCFLTKHLIYSQPTLQWRDIEATRFPIQRTAWRRPGRVWPRITPGSRDTIRDVRTGSRSKCCSRAARRKKNLHKRLITLITFKKQPILLIHNDLCGVSQAIVSIVSNCLQNVYRWLACLEKSIEDALPSRVTVQGRSLGGLPSAHMVCSSNSFTMTKTTVFGPGNEVTTERSLIPGGHLNKCTCDRVSLCLAEPIMTIRESPAAGRDLC